LAGGSDQTVASISSALNAAVPATGFTKRVRLSSLVWRYGRRRAIDRLVLVAATLLGFF
jgi:hypothetical protein